VPLPGVGAVTGVVGTKLGAGAVAGTVSDFCKSSGAAALGFSRGFSVGIGLSGVLMVIFIEPSSSDFAV